MAQIQLTNLTSNALPLGDLGSKSLAGNETITITRPANALPQMASVIAAVAAGTLSVTVTPTAAELASGFLSPPQSVQAEDLAPVAATDAAAVCGKWRLPMTAGTPGTADDVTLFAVNNLPFKVRVLGVTARIATAIPTATVTARTQSGGAGTAFGAIDAGTAGLVHDDGKTATTVLTPGSTVGVYARRSDRGVAGELFIEWRRES